MDTNDDAGCRSQMDISSPGMSMHNREEYEFDTTEKAKTLVCDRCWNNVFNTEAFEALGRGEEELKYNITGGSLNQSVDEGCSWCTFLRDMFPPKKPHPEAEAVWKITLKLDKQFSYTPAGNNVYDLSIGTSSWYYSHICSFSSDGEGLAAGLVTARPLLSDVSPASTRNEMIQLIDDCANHEDCHQDIEPHLPTRVIDVKELKIITAKGARGKYAALSYCWGPFPQEIVLTASGSWTLETLSRGIDLEALPQTIKDAVLVCRAIDIPYLWVDALCIIQDDRKDKVQEISKMAQVYGNSFIAIVAASASAATEGFLQLRSPESESVAIPYRVSEGVFGRVNVARVERPEDPRDPIDHRAWTLQEQQMPKRLLRYSSRGLEWQCASGSKKVGRSLHIPQFNSLLTSQSSPSTSPEEALTQWSYTVIDYSTRKMSLPSDKLPAVAAIASQFSPSLGPGYYAGIWEHSLVDQLLWFPYSLHDESDRGSTPYRAPSWSWACWDGNSRLPDPRKPRAQTYACTVVTARVTLRDELLPYGEIEAASLTIRAKLLPIWTAKNGSEIYRSYCSYKIPVASNPPESPSAKFLRLQHANSSGLSQNDAASTKSKDFVGHPKFDATLANTRNDMSAPGLVYYLPLVIKESSSRATQTQHRCEGLIIVLDGEDTFRRIGIFDALDISNLEGLPEEEVALV